mmetsp:Transcript_6978/g.24410  ORF Transcript_6978/g.24410 Transcript_6978/m.24410 type:complete len:87 (+) Transcript_6978:91-351(+)
MSDIFIAEASMPRISNLNSPTNVWSQGCIPYSSPALGVVELESFVDLKAAKGSRVRIAQVLKCFHKQLALVHAIRPGFVIILPCRR